MELIDYLRCLGKIKFLCMDGSVCENDFSRFRKTDEKKS